jgi:hypothetical protein
MSRPGRTARIALAGFLLAGIAPPCLLWLFGWPSGWEPIRRWYLRHAGSDSWRPIRDALAYVTTHPSAGGLYEQTYWQSAYQFMYSPLSLLLVEWTEWPPFLEWRSHHSLNRLSWIVMLAVFGATALFCYRIARIAGPGPATRGEAAGLAALGVCASLFFYPLMYAYAIGQIQTWLDLALILALILWLAGHRVAVGVLIGLVCVVKVNVGAVLLWAVLRRQWRFVGGFALVFALLGPAALMRYGWAVHAEYLDLLAHLSRRGESFVSNQSFNGLLNRAIFNGNNLEWDGTHQRIRLIGWVYAATLVSSLVLILPSLWPWRGRGRLAGTADFAIALVTFSLASPIAYEIHFGFLVPVFALALVVLARADTPRAAWWGLGLAYALCANRLSITDALAPTYFNFLQSTMFFGLLILLALLFRCRLVLAARAA